MRITATIYRCDQCNREERDVSQVLNWLTVRILRNEVAPTRSMLMWRRDFCSRACLAKWASDDDVVIPSSGGEEKA